MSTTNMAATDDAKFDVCNYVKNVFIYIYLFFNLRSKNFSVKVNKKDSNM